MASLLSFFSSSFSLEQSLFFIPSLCRGQGCAVAVQSPALLIFHMLRSQSRRLFSPKRKVFSSFNLQHWISILTSPAKGLTRDTLNVAVRLPLHSVLVFGSLLHFMDTQTWFPVCWKTSLQIKWCWLCFWWTEELSVLFCFFFYYPTSNSSAATNMWWAYRIWCTAADQTTHQHIK